MIDWQDKPNIISDPVEGPFFIVKSPDGNTLVPLGVTNEGSLTINDVPIEGSELGDTVEPDYNPTTGLLEKLTTKSGGNIVKEELLTWSQGKITQVSTKYYNNQGVLIKTITEAMTYKGNGQIQTITKTVS